MRFDKLLLIIAGFLIYFYVFQAHAQVTPRPISATSIVNQGGILYIPTVTPLGNRACFWDNNSTAASSITTASELAFLHGVTSNVQAQLDSVTTGAVTSVFTRVGNVVAQAADYAAFYLQISNNLSDLSDVTAARTNLGLGTAAVQASSAFDPSGSAATAQAAAIAASDPSGSAATAQAAAIAASDPSGSAATALVAAQSSSLQKASNLGDLPSPTTARGNLGLGTAAVANTSAFDASGAAAAVLASSLQAANNLSDLIDAAAARIHLGLGTAATQPSTAFVASVSGTGGITSTGGNNPMIALGTQAAIIFGQIATPANPLFGTNKLYFKSDGNLYSLDTFGVENQISQTGGGSGVTVVTASLPLVSSGGTTPNITLGNINAFTFNQVLTPATPSAGTDAIYVKSDDNLYILNSSGTEVQIGTPSGNLSTPAYFDSSGKLASIPGENVTTENGVNTFQSVDMLPTSFSDSGVDITPSAPTTGIFRNVININGNLDPGNTGFAMGDPTSGNGGVSYFTVNANHQGSSADVGQLSVINGHSNLGDGTIHAHMNQFNEFSHGVDVANGYTLDSYTGLGLFPNFHSGSISTSPATIRTDASYDGTITGFAYSAALYANFGAASTTSHFHSLELGGDGSTTGNISDYLGLNVYINNVVATDYTLYSGFPSGINVTNFNGLNVGASGTAINVQGIGIDVNNLVSPNEKTALNVSGGSFHANYNADTADFTPGGEFGIHEMGGQLTISAGHPINAGQFGFGSNFGSQIQFNDDMGPDSSGFNLGWSLAGFAAQVGGAVGKTFTTLNYMLAAAEDLGTDGHIASLFSYRAAGLLATGGTPITIDEDTAYEVDHLMDFNTGAVLQWGFRNSANNNNWFKKNLVVAGASRLPTNSSVGIELAGTTQSFLFSRLTTTQRLALTAVNGMQVYDTTLDTFECFAAGIWGACSTSAGSGTVSSVSVVSANGLAGTVATPTTTPVITLTTTVTGLIKGAAGALVAAVAGTDYQAPIGSFACSAGQFINQWTAPNTFTCATPAGGGGGSPRTTNVVSANFTIPTLTGDYILNVNTTSGVKTTTLPDATASNGWCVDVKDVGANSVSVATTSAQTIDGAGSDSIVSLNDSRHYCAIAGNWNNY